MAKSKKKVAKPAKKSSGSIKKVSKPAAKKAKPAAKKAIKPAKRVKPAVKKTIVTKLVKKTSKTLKPVSKPASKVTRISVKSATPASGKPKKGHDRTKTRYSDGELGEFRQLIIEKVEAAKKELKYLQDQISRAGDNTSDDTDSKYASMEDGGSSMEREYLNQMAARQRLYLDHLDKALVRIQNKTYGICRVTGKLIDKERLRAVPHATLSMDAKMNQQHPQPTNIV
jgi:RNA polymerase-binding transcription factor DksA